MAKITGHVIVSANHLLTGDTIYLTPMGWSGNIADAQIAEAANADTLLDRAKAEGGIAVGPDFAAVVHGPHGPVPAHRREQIRRDGPSVGALNPDLGARHQRPRAAA
ncbi:MAG: hypothetical protein ACJAVR_003319 [Paracoccaceae bacterium]|jgi:hypothetical protein